ncbi:MAG: hypothetical protein U9O20_01125 [Patescibacteria group bacterium]|nr:hypothetical protein [Patescibacteria group bacterium]
MINKLLFFALTLSILLGVFFASEVLAEAEVHDNKVDVYPVRIYMFHSDTCPHCYDELEFLDKIQQQYPNIELHDFELTSSIENQSLFKQVIQLEGLSGGVPVTIIADQVIVGFDNENGVGKKLIGLIEKYSVEPGISWLDEVFGFGELNDDSKICLERSYFPKAFVKKCESDSVSDDDYFNENEDKEVSVFGKEISLGDGASVFGLGVLLGLADGINPCMFSVLLFLLTYLLAIGSRKKAFKTGLAFTATTFVVYFLLMFGIIKVIDVFAIEKYARGAIIAVALIAGLIMVKDFFFYGKWISLEISARFKPTIEKLIKRGTIPSAILLALVSSIVELPCTSVLPLAYAGVLTSRDLSPFWPLILYNTFFVLPLLLIIVLVTFAWAKVENFEQMRVKYRKYMRLGAGILLILLAVAFWTGVL